MSTALVIGGLLGLAPTSAVADQTVTYTADVTVPAPPASTFAGSGGGDGWGLAFTPTQVFNVFHHSDSLTVACHAQADASACWTAPKTVVDGNGNSFSTSIGPGLYLDQRTGFLYVPVTRTPDNTAGFACIDTTKPVAATGPELFCGFTALSAVGDGQIGGGSTTSAPVQVGSKLYTFNEHTGPATGTQDTLLCLDLSTLAACAGQPFAIDRGGVDFAGIYYSYPIGAAGSRIFLQVAGGSTNELACFDTATDAECSGSWPAANNGSNGSPFPMLDASGSVIGVCTPTSGTPCFGLDGASVATPAGMATAIGSSVNYNGPALTIASRVYVPNASTSQVGCYDYNLAAGCANFPKSFQNLSLLYSVNADPQRPTCIWVNADNGSAQIQNFDAYTGGGCGAGAIRVLASSIVVPNNACIPASYTSLQIVDPPRSGYSSGAIDFQDGSGNPIPGFATHPLDGTGTADLRDLALSTTNALPQFLISLNDSGAPSSVHVRLTWTGSYADGACVKDGVVVSGLQPPAAPDSGQGYRLAAGDGGVFAFRSIFAGSSGGTPRNGRTVGLARTPNGAGYWLADSDGGVQAFGAPFLGSAPGLGLSIADTVGIAATRSGNGYWLVEGNGGVLTFGDAPFLGSAPGLGLHLTNVVGMARTPSGNGYWLVTRNGDVIPFGDAGFFGSVRNLGLGINDVKTIVASPSGSGYWLATGDGGVFGFGDAPFLGSAPTLHISITDVRGMARTPSGLGYWLVEANGGVLTFGDAQFLGAVSTTPLNAPVVGMAS